MRGVLRIVVLGLAMVPAGCSPLPFGLEVTGPLDRPELELKKSANRLLTRSLCVREIVVSEAPAAPGYRVKWRVFAPDSCVALTRLTYGETPRGLVAATPAEPLIPGVRYRVFGEAEGGQRGGGVIVFEDGAWRLAPDRAPEASP